MKRIVIIGYGNMGRKYADMIYKGEVPGLSIVGIVCRNERGQREIQRKMPGVTVLGNEEQLAEFNEYDGCIIAVPHREHVRIAEMMAERGKHILCEKPVSVAAGDCIRLKMLIEEKDIVFSMIFNWRARKVYRQVHDYLEKGMLGRLHNVVWIADFWFRPQCYHRLSSWRSSWKGEGGGLLINQSQHILDLWNWLFGQPTQVYAELGFGHYSNIEVDDRVFLIFSHENGMVGSFMTASGDFPGSNHLEIHGEMGKLIVENNRITVYRNETATSRIIEDSQEINPKIPYTVQSWEIEQEEDEYRVILKNFFEAMHYGEKPCAGLQDGIRALENANAAYLSGWKKEKVNIPCNPQKYKEQLEKHCKV